MRLQPSLTPLLEILIEAIYKWGVASIAILEY